MSGQFYAGCAAGGIIALGMILLAVWGANRGNSNIAKKNREANDLSARLLRRRNRIGERQSNSLVELAMIAELDRKPKPSDSHG